MIVKDHEKKASGFISVTWITARAHVSALPGPPAGAAIVYTSGSREAMAGPRMAMRAFLSPPWRRRHRPMMRNNGCSRRSRAPRAGPLPRLAVADLPATR
jgi:hypothetical protein